VIRACLQVLEDSFDRKVLVIRLRSISGMEIRGSEVYITVTVNSVLKRCSSYPASDYVEMSEYLDYEVGPDVRSMTLLLYRSSKEGQDWDGSAEVNILPRTKGEMLDKSLSVDLTDKQGRFIGGITEV
jgi:hypothetical protein